MEGVVYPAIHFISLSQCLSSFFSLSLFISQEPTFLKQNGACIPLYSLLLALMCVQNAFYTLHYLDSPSWLGLPPFHAFFQVAECKK